MKSFLKKKWFGIPVGILAVLMALVLVAGSAFASYNVWMGNANVDVVESITVSNTGNDGGEEFTGSAGDYAWDVSLYPGESRTLNVLVSNASSASLSIGVTFNSSHTALGVGSSGSGTVSVTGGGSEVLSLTVTADGDASPGSYTIFFKIERS